MLAEGVRLRSDPPAALEGSKRLCVAMWRWVGSPYGSKALRVVPRASESYKGFSWGRIFFKGYRWGCLAHPLGPLTMAFNYGALASCLADADLIILSTSNNISVCSDDIVIDLDLRQPV